MDEELAMQYQRGYIDGFKEGKAIFEPKIGCKGCIYENAMIYQENDQRITDQPCDDAISRQAVIDVLYDIEKLKYRIDIENVIKTLPPVKPQEKTGQFAKWVATEIFDDMWEYNKDSFAEIACRKLEKLGIVMAKGDEWELIEEQERSE